MTYKSAYRFRFISAMAVALMLCISMTVVGAATLDNNALPPVDKKTTVTFDYLGVNFEETKELSIQGKISDKKSGRDLTMASIAIRVNGKVVTGTYSTKSGSFILQLPNMNIKSFDLVITVPNYYPVIISDVDPQLDSMIFNIKMNPKPIVG